jgi:NAD-dependent dihydropyrimidine dehydrogenase PreA subunit
VPYAIGGPCVDVTDRSCLEECPVDCIYEGDRKLYINPKECIDCGACEPVCPVEAIVSDRAASAEFKPWIADNARFFEDVLPGRAAALGNPGGALRAGPIGVDTELAAQHAAATERATA